MSPIKNNTEKVGCVGLGLQSKCVFVGSGGCVGDKKSAQLKQFNMAQRRLFDDSVEIIDFNIVGRAIGCTGRNPGGLSALGAAVSVHYTNIRGETDTLSAHFAQARIFLLNANASSQRKRVHEQVDVRASIWQGGGVSMGCLCWAGQGNYVQHHFLVHLWTLTLTSITLCFSFSVYISERAVHCKEV